MGGFTSKPKPYDPRVNQYGRPIVAQPQPAYRPNNLRRQQALPQGYQMPSSVYPAPQQPGYPQQQPGYPQQQPGFGQAPSGYGVQGPPGYRPYGGKKNKNKKNGGAVALNGAPVNYASPMYQPTPAVANWAVTAGLPTPATGMGNVAHGGKRKTHRHNKSKAHSKKSRRNKNKKNH